MNRQDIKYLLREQECIVYLGSYTKSGDGIVDVWDMSITEVNNSIERIFRNLLNNL